MFELPGLDRACRKSVITAEVVEGKARPLYIYSERRDEKSARQPPSALLWP